MNQHFTFLWIDIGIAMALFLLSSIGKLGFYKAWRQWLPVVLIVAGIFIAWDVYFTVQGVWWFNRDYTLSLRIAYLPIEEWLFFAIMACGSAIMYRVVNAFCPLSVDDISTLQLSGFAIALIVFAGLNIRRAYSVSAFGAVGFGLLLVGIFGKGRSISGISPLILPSSLSLALFLIVRFVLSSLPILHYDQSENIGINIYQLPVEEIFFGALLPLTINWFISYRQIRKCAENSNMR